MAARLIDRTDRRNPPDDTGHGPECPIGAGLHAWRWNADKGEWRRRGNRGHPECQCVLCHCGPHQRPGGFLDACANCGRPIAAVIAARRARFAAQVA